MAVYCFRQPFGFFIIMNSPDLRQGKNLPNRIYFLKIQIEIENLLIKSLKNNQKKLKIYEKKVNLLSTSILSNRIRKSV